MVNDAFWVEARIEAGHDCVLNWKSKKYSK